MGLKQCISCGEEFFGSLEGHKSESHPESYACRIIDFGEAWGMGRAYCKSIGLLTGIKEEDNKIIKEFVVGAVAQSGIYTYLQPTQRESEREPKPPLAKVDEAPVTQVPLMGFVPRRAFSPVRSVGMTSQSSQKNVPSAGKQTSTQ
jgi:hypothetical protein